METRQWVWSIGLFLSIILIIGFLSAVGIISWISLFIIIFVLILFFVIMFIVSSSGIGGDKTKVEIISTVTMDEARNYLVNTYCIPFNISTNFRINSIAFDSGIPRSNNLKSDDDKEVTPEKYQTSIWWAFSNNTFDNRILYVLAVDKLDNTNCLCLEISSKDVNVYEFLKPYMNKNKRPQEHEMRRVERVREDGTREVNIVNRQTDIVNNVKDNKDTSDI